MEVNEALGMLGMIGRWQILRYTMISIGCSFPTCLHMLAIVYIGIKACFHYGCAALRVASDSER